MGVVIGEAPRSKYRVMVAEEDEVGALMKVLEDPKVTRLVPKVPDPFRIVMVIL